MERFDRTAFSKLKGDVPTRWREIRLSNHAIVREMFEAGHSINSIAKATNLSRACVNTIFEELSLKRPDVSEGNRRSAAMATEGQRKARAASAHDAVRKLGRHVPTQIRHAMGKQVTGDYVGVGEAYLAEKLLAKGLESTPQAAIKGYNIDLLCDHLAVEVHNYTTRPTERSHLLARSIDLMCGGISVIYVRTGPTFPEITDAAVNQVVAFYNETSGNPSALGQYRVVRGDGQVDWTCERQLHHLANVCALYASLKTGT